MTGISALLGSTAMSSGGGDPVITLATPTFSDDFNAYADGTRLVAGDPNANYGQGTGNPGNLGWDAITTAAANNSRFNLVIVSGEARDRTASNFGASEADAYIMAPPVTCPTDSYTQWDMDCLSATPQQFRHVAIRGQDQNNFIRMQHTAAATGVNVLSFNRRSAGANSAITGLNPTASAVKLSGANTQFRPLAAIEKITAVVCNERLYLRRGNGFQIGDPAGYAVSGLTGNRFGLPPRGFSNSRISSLKMGDAALAITINSNHRTWVPKRRTASTDPITSGTGTEVFSGSVLRTPPTRLQYALRDPVTGALVKDWALIPTADATITSSTWTATISGIPCGLNGRNAYAVGVRPVDASNQAHDELAVFSGKHFYVALTFGVIGQSNAGQLVQAAETGNYTPLFPGCMDYTKADPPSLTQGTYIETTNFYIAGQAPSTRCIAPLGDDLSQFWNVPIAFNILAIAARGAGVLGPIDGSTGMPHPATDWPYIQTHHAFAGGAYDALILSQGENEDVANGDLWEVRWQANIAAYRDPSMSGQPAGTVIPVFYGITGYQFSDVTSVGSTTSMKARDAGQLNLRNSVSDCILAYHAEGAARRLIGAPGDDVHFERNAVSRGIGDLAKRLSRSIRKYYGAAIADGMGPIPTGATRSGAVVTLTYDLNGAASLQARSAADSSIAGDNLALTSFVVSANDFASNLTINSAVISGNTVVITLASDPGGPVRVDVLRGPVPDGSSYPCGLYADGSYIGARRVLVPLLTPS